MAKLGSSIEWILRDVSSSSSPVRPQPSSAGCTGAGKTTIVSLMMRFYDIQSGSILVDGVDVRLHDLKQLRQRFGVVLQDPFLFTGDDLAGQHPAGVRLDQRTTE